MTVLRRSVLFFACLALAAQTSVATAQSKVKSKGAMAPKTEQVSRAFTMGYNVPSTGVAMEGYCPVCYLAANKAAKGNPDIAYEHNGITYWFVSEPVRDTFIANPEKYIPAYGGWCAVGVAMGQRFPVDPTNFKIVDGRVMLFLKNGKVDATSIWDKNAAENLKKADANWEKLKG